MLAMGVSLAMQQIIAPLRDGKLVASALFGSFVVLGTGQRDIAAALVVAGQDLDDPKVVGMVVVVAIVGLCPAAVG